MIILDSFENSLLNVGRETNHACGDEDKQR